MTLRRALFAGATIGVLAAIAFATWPSSAPAEVDDAPRGSSVAADAPDARAVRPRSMRPAAPVDTLRPLSGTGPAAAARDGNGSVAVVNQGERDAAVALAREGRHVYATYVRAGEKVQIVGVAPGAYDVLVTVGAVWRGDGFTIDAEFLRHREPLQIREPAAGEPIDRAAGTLTLPATFSSAGFVPAEPFRVQLSPDKSRPLINGR